MRPSIILLTATLLHAQQLTLTPTIPDDQIQSLLASHPGPAVAAILDAHGRRVLTHNADAAGTFDFGPIAPTLTALLLQNMAAAGEVSLNDPVAKYLPATSVPTNGKKQITLLDLATHTSGLPSTGPMPAQLARKPGKYEYSPLGIALLNQALAARANTDFDSLLRMRVLEPLAMNGTRFDAEHRLRGAAGDLLNLLSAYMGPTEPPVNKDMQSFLKTRRSIKDTLEAAPGWQVRKTNYCARKGVCFMNQVYDLFTSEGAASAPAFIGFDANARTAVVILSASGTVSSLGLYLLAPYAYPLK